MPLSPISVEHGLEGPHDIEGLSAALCVVTLEFGIRLRAVQGELKT